MVSYVLQPNANTENICNTERLFYDHIWLIVQLGLKDSKLKLIGILKWQRNETCLWKKVCAVEC